MTSEFFISLGVLCIVVAVFFILQGYYRFKDWQEDYKDELWRFLSFFSGGAGLILLGIGLIGIAYSVIYTIYTAWINLSFIGLLLEIAALGLITYFSFLKWHKTK